MDQSVSSKCHGPINTEKIRNAYRLWRSNFARRERKPKCGKKNSKVTYSVLLIMAFFPAENENRPLEDLQHSDFSHVPGRFLLSVRTKSKIENFVHSKLRPLLVFVVFQPIFPSWTLTPAHFTVWGIVDPFIFFH